MEEESDELTGKKRQMQEKAGGSVVTVGVMFILS